MCFSAFVGIALTLAIVLGLLFLGTSTTAGAFNSIVTILKLRAPGMSIDRMPLFLWSSLTMSFSVVFAMPALGWRGSRG